MTRPKKPMCKIRIENKIINKFKTINKLPECEAGNFSQLCQFSKIKDNAATKPKKTQVKLPKEKESKTIK